MSMTGNDMRANPQLTAQYREQLLSNPQFQTWARGVGNAVTAPERFGITGLPKGAWIDKQGNVLMTASAMPGFQQLWPLIAAATAGTAGALGAFGGAGSAAAAPLAPTVPGSYASGLYASGGWGVPGAAGAAPTGLLSATIPGSVASSIYASGGLTPPSATAGSNIAGTAASGFSAANAARRAAEFGGLGKTAVDTANGLANGSSLLKDIISKYVPLGLAGLSAFKGFQQPAANKDLEDVIGLAKNRVNASEPLFNALNKMALGGLPDYTKQ